MYFIHNKDTENLFVIYIFWILCVLIYSLRSYPFFRSSALTPHAYLVSFILLYLNLNPFDLSAMLSFLSLPCLPSFTLKFLVHITQNRLVQTNSSEVYKQLYYATVSPSPRSALTAGARKHCTHQHANISHAHKHTNSRSLLQSPEK